MKKALLVFAFITCTAIGSVNAQSYNWGVGVRGGFVASGVTVKHNFSASSSVEGIFDFAKGFNVYGIYERNVPIIAQGFNFTYGLGGNIGSWKRHREKKFTVGINGMVGLEYKLHGIPIAFSIDYNPVLNFIGHSKFYPGNAGIGVKFVF